MRYRYQRTYAMTLQPLDDYAHLMPIIDGWETEQANYLGGLLYSVVYTISVIDFGCATGLYLKPFSACGCWVLGLDGEPTAGKLLDLGEFELCDLREPHDPFISFLGKPYSLALCIEVAEHLQPEYADTLVDTVASSADVIFWSAARPGQGGENHYNEQHKGYWLEKFYARDFELHPQNDYVCEQISANDDCRKVSWLLNNAMLLTRVV